MTVLICTFITYITLLLMNYIYLVLVSLLSFVGLAALTTQNLFEQRKESVANTAFAQPGVAQQDSTTAVSKASKKNKKKEKKPAAANITMKRELNRATISQRSAEGSNVEIVITSSGMPMRDVQDLQMIGSSGSPVSSGSYIGFDNVTFPFEGNVRFKASN